MVKVFSVLLTIGLASSAFAQGGRTEITGTVLDQAKAVLPGVTVTVVNEATGLQRAAVTSGDGRFVIPTLVPGTYTIKAELQGFQTVTQTGVVLSVGQEVAINLTLAVAGLAETITVTGESPLVEVTSSKIGSNITNAEIDGLPSQGRNQLSLMQLVPGLTPSLNPGSFEGGQYNANGQATTANLFLVDGAYDNDDRRGGSQGTQARVTLDAMAEYQVLTHHYSAEYGGSSGVVVNAVTRSGANQFAGRGFYYYQNDDLNATNYFLKLAGEENPESGSNVFGGSAGGPIVRNKAFWFANAERTLNREAANLNFPPDAAPLAVSYSTTTDFTGWNTFVRSDYQLTSTNHLSFRWLREAVLTENDEIEGNNSTLDNATFENDSGDQVFSLAATSILSNRATNEFKVGHVRENLLQGPRLFFDDSWNFIGLDGREQFDLGSMNAHPSYNAGPRNNYQEDLIRSFAVDDSFTYFHPGWHGDHTLKAGVGWSRNAALPQGTAANLVGLFNFPTNTAFDPANARTYPNRFQIRVGQIDYEQTDWRTNFYVQDKWQLGRQVTLNLGVRYDYQHLTPSTKNAFSPRVGVAYDLLGTGKTLLRGGFGKYYQLHQLNVIQTLLTSAVIGPTFVFDTTEVASPAQTGVIPVHTYTGFGFNGVATGCLQPSGNNGLAVIGPTCEAFLTDLRARVLAGGYVNNQPTLDGERRLPYLWAFSVGMKHQLGASFAVSADYVANRGRDQVALIDINEGPPGPNGRITRLGVDVFDPTGELIPPQARSTNFIRVLQYQSREELNTDYNALELALDKRLSQRWSGRVSYTLARARDVGAITYDTNLRGDYGRTSFDNRHALAMSGNVNVWRGLGAGFVFRYYSGYPINETIGSDSISFPGTNGDGDANDRPVQGLNDTTRPIRSPVDSNGRAIRNGIQGEKQMLLDSRFHYLWRLQRRYEAGLFLEIYNLTNHVNFGNPTGNRNSSNYMVRTVAGDPRTVQFGVRLTF
jgi:Carboxypeptidase regulatory-like domain/TonB dependent receptor-like, beta-barrel